MTIIGRRHGRLDFLRVTTLEQRVAERTAELSESQTQLRQLSAHAERAREDESMRIARDVHDQLGGSLTSLKMTLARAAKGRDDDADLTAKFMDMRSQIDELVQTVRRVASDLRPPLLDDFGLLAALDWQMREWEKRTGIACDLTVPPDEIEIDSERRVQEGHRPVLPPRHPRRSPRAVAIKMRTIRGAAENARPAEN